MRRSIILILAIAAITVLFAACSQATAQPAKPVTDFSAAAQVDTAGTQLSCEVSHTKEGVSSVTVTKPDGLKGLCFKWLGGAYSIEYNKLYCQTTSDYLPQQSFARAIVNVLNVCASPEELSLAENENNLCVYTGSCDSGNFKVTCDSKTGLIQTVEIDGLSLKVEFANHKQFE